MKDVVLSLALVALLACLAVDALVVMAMIRESRKNR